MSRIAYVLLFVLLTYQFIVQATNTPDTVHSRVEVTLDDRPKRTLFNIVWGCLSTTIICAWAALHPNIPPCEGSLKGGLRRLELMFWTIIAPEILPCWALNQRLAAATVRDVYNEAKVALDYKQDGIWKTLKGWFSLYEITGAVNPAWTLKHGHYLIMGGIHLVEPVDREVGGTEAERAARDVNVELRNTPLVEANTEKGRPSSENPPEAEEGRVTILTLEMLRELVKDEEFKIRLTEAEITRTSKGDGLSKAIFILQSSWFIVQCIARHVQGLDLTQLELTTLALASLNGITFILWWDKPLGAQTIVRVYMKRKLTDKERNTSGRKNSWRSKLIPLLQEVFGGCLTTIRDVVLCRNKEDIRIFPLALFVLLLSPISASTMAFIATLADLWGKSSSFPVNATHVPTFYVPNHPHPKYIHISILLLFGIIFGGIHCAGWNLPFPTYPEQKLWRVASLGVTVIPMGAVLLSLTIALILRSVSSDSDSDSDSNVYFAMQQILLLFPLVVTAYACARLVLLGLALALLRHLPQNMFIAVDWSQFYPHFF